MSTSTNIFKIHGFHNDIPTWPNLVQRSSWVRSDITFWMFRRHDHSLIQHSKPLEHSVCGNREWHTYFHKSIFIWRWRSHRPSALARATNVPNSNVIRLWRWRSHRPSALARATNIAKATMEPKFPKHPKFHHLKFSFCQKCAYLPRTPYIVNLSEKKFKKNLWWFPPTPP